MGTYRKKPVEIEAYQYNGSNTAAKWLTEWSDGAVLEDEETGVLYITTLEGTMRAYANNWIIKGVNGEFYPCDPDVFEKTYDLAEDTDQAGN